MLRVRDMSLYGHKRIRKALLVGSMTLSLFLYGIVFNEAFNPAVPVLQAKTAIQSELRGFAWSDNIGWISFNCLDTANCDDVNYSVDLMADNTLEGFAWSDNIGWIKFGGFKSFPKVKGTVAGNAEIVNDSLVGWARACAGTENGDCSSTKDHEDGWDGWISLQGNNYGVNFSGDEATDFAWGSDVVGWIDWNPFGLCTGASCNPCYEYGVCIARPFDYILDVSNSVEIERGGSDDIAIDLERVEGYAETVTLSTGLVAEGLTVNISNPSCLPDCTKVLEVSVVGNMTPGEYPILVKGISESGIERTDTITVVVPIPPFPTTLSCTASPAQINTGESVVWTATVNLAGDYSYIWEDQQGNNVGTGQSITVEYDTEGIKILTVTATDNESSATDSCSANVLVKKEPGYEEF